MLGRLLNRSPGGTVRARRSFTGPFILGVFAVLGLVCCAGLIWPIVKTTVGEMADLIFGVVILAVTVAAHRLTTWWALTTKPHWSRWVLAQTPYLVMYVLLYVWYGVGFTLAEGGPPPLWYLPWAGLALVAMSWLWLWWLDLGDRTNPKRTIVFLALLGLLVAGNGSAGMVVAFHNSQGFGLRGAASPKEAVTAFTAVSCLFDHDMFPRSGKTVATDCPSRGASPDTRIGEYTSSSQPRDALERWYRIAQQFTYLPLLRYTKVQVISQDSSTATVQVPVELPIRAEGQDLSRIPRDQAWCVPGNRVETWTIHLEPALAGGWKVSRLDVADPVTVVPFTGSRCDVGR